MELTSVQLKKIKKSDLRFLFDLLEERDPIVNISHIKMPTYDEHVKFVMSKPYSKWYVAYYDGKKCGSVYLTKQNEIGIHIRKGFPTKQICNNCYEILLKLNPRKRYLANCNPKNTSLINFFKKKGFKLIQYTYELRPDSG
ncbi:hypothetical protein [Candidatus Nitrosotenuis chungbukensis]|uniref:hypothetical protein n=1 Tax=Candidatus Nitrosotenuis chungbukensis TaxID=1353246 RepID=UPI0005B28E43|nr:hypothetical protein [Candidatus Nitrosotenuis chungbukensis]